MATRFELHNYTTGKPEPVTTDVGHAKARQFCPPALLSLFEQGIARGLNPVAALSAVLTVVNELRGK